MQVNELTSSVTYGRKANDLERQVDGSCAPETDVAISRSIGGMSPADPPEAAKVR